MYARPYDPLRPVMCMDETNKQPIGKVREPLSGQRQCRAGKRRTRRAWALWIAGMLETRYRQAERVVLVMDDLNTHGIGSLYATFTPAKARRLAERLEIHYTPKHGSWLNMAEIELSALCRQCLNRRIPDLRRM